VNKIKNILFVFLFIIFPLNSDSLAITDSIIGTVGNKPVTSSDLLNEMKMLLIVNGQKFTEDKRVELKSMAIKSINERLIKKIALEENNFDDFNEKDLMQEVYKISNKLNIKTDDLKKIFKRNNVNFSNLTDHLETELKWNGLIFYLYKNRVKVNVNEINERLKLIQNQKFLEEYLIYEIQIPQMDEQKFKKKISEIKNDIQVIGFEKAAYKHSKAKTALNGGKLGWIKEAELSEKIKKILKLTSVGEVTEPIIMSEGVMLLKLADKKKTKDEIDLEETKNILLNAEKNKKLTMHSKAHYNKLKQSILINYNIK